jgi:ABC-type phosphate transport system substrate-binding protein
MTRAVLILLILMPAAVIEMGVQPTRANPLVVPQDEDLAIIVHQSNPTENLTFGELRQIFMEEKSRWPNGRKVTVVMRDLGQPERDSVLREIYRMKEPDFNRYFLHAQFTGETLDPPKLLSTATGVLRFVFNVPGAIGYVRASEVDPTVKVVRIDGVAPRNPGYKIKLIGP